MRLASLLVWLLLSGLVHGQTKIIDSLRDQVNRATDDEKKLGAYLALFEEYQSLNRDSMDVYAPVLYALAEKSKNIRYKYLADLAYANWYFRWGWSDSAIYFAEKNWASLNPSDPALRDIYFKTGRAIALFRGGKSRYLDALEVLYKLLPEAERYKDTLALGLLSNTVASVNLGRGQPRESLVWSLRAIRLGQTGRGFPQIVAPSCVNAANAYVLLQRPDSVEYYMQKALPLCRQLQNLHYLATGLRVLADLYTRQGRITEAEKALLEMVETRQKTVNAAILVEENLMLAEFYAQSGQINKAIDLCLLNLQKGELVNDVAAQATVVYTNDPKVRVNYLQALSGYYKKAEKWKEYQVTLEELVQAKDSLYLANSAEAIADLETKYEVQKKENTILQQKYDLQQKNFQFIASLVLIGLLLAAGIAIFRHYRRKQRMRIEKLTEEEKRKAVEAVREAEEKERRRIAADLHDNLGAYAASMAANLDYLDMNKGSEEEKQAFLALRNNSQSIISQLNDTIWVLKRDALRLTAISDRVKVFLNRIQSGYRSVQFEVIESIDNDTLLSSAQAFHLYRIIQESVVNALKHSQGNRITVRIISTGNWQVSIHDNGKGMSGGPDSGREGNGLDNIRSRCEQEGWKVDWESGENGTTVVLTGTTN